MAVATSALFAATFSATVLGEQALRGAQDILVDHDEVAVRSTIERIPTPDDGTRPMLIEISY